MRLKEIWKPVKGYEDYEVSDMGNVRSLKNGKVKLLKPRLKSNGYLDIELCKDGKKKKFYVHRLVVTVFIGDIPKGMVVNHLNENKLDNRLQNLEICTVKQNTNHGQAQERKAKAISKELQLTNAKTSAKYTFSSSCEASEFFGYKAKGTLGVLISQARKKGKNFIKIRKIKHYFVQESDK